MVDLISRQAAIDAIRKEYAGVHNSNIDGDFLADEIEFIISKVPPVQLFGYNLDMLAYIATVMQKEGITAEYAVRTLNDMRRMVRMILEEAHHQADKILNEWKE